MFRKAKIFSLGIMHIYTLAYIVYILCERVTFSRQSSTYNQPFNKWHIHIKSQQLYLVARLCCVSHFICTFNNKFSRSLAIHCYQLWGIRDIKRTDMKQTWKTGAKKRTGQAWNRDLMIKEVPKERVCAIAAIPTSGAAARAQLDWQQFLSGRTALRAVNTLPPKAALGQATFQRHLCAATNRGAKRYSRAGGEREKERKGVSALKCETDARLRPQRFTLTI